MPFPFYRGDYVKHEGGVLGSKKSEFQTILRFARQKKKHAHRAMMKNTAEKHKKIEMFLMNPGRAGSADKISALCCIYYLVGMYVGMYVCMYVCIVITYSRV